MNEVSGKIIAEENICIITHISPDGDALGSSLALYILLKNMGKKCRILCDDMIPHKYMFLPRVQDIARPEKGEACGCAVSVDCADLHLMGDASELFKAARLQVCIDHHASNPHYAPHEVLDTGASSAGEVVFNIIQDMQAQITDDIAICLFTAISADTGNFSYSNTSKQTFLAAAELSTHNIDIVDITSRLHKIRSATYMRLLARTLKSLTLYLDGKLAVISLTKQEIDELQDGVTEYEGLIDSAREIEGVEAAAFLREVGENRYKVSLRSRPQIDVRLLAEKYSGGGHTNAAGCQINGTLEEAIQTLTKEFGVILG